VIVRRKDGSDLRTVVAGYRGHGLIGDRFGIFDPPFVYNPHGGIAFSDGSLGDAAVLYDRCSGRTGLIGPLHANATARAQIRLGALAPQLPILFWKDSKKWYTVLDLSRISDQACG
jgi:hypothetical protein